MKISMLSTLPPIKGLSYYTLDLVKALSNECEIDFYGFKSLYPDFLYPGGTKTDEPEPKIKNVKIFNYLTWYNPFSWIKTGFSVKTKIFHVQWWSWFLAPVYLVVLSIAKHRKKKIIMTIHNVKPHEKAFYKKIMNSSVIHLADEYIVHSENNKKLFKKLTKTKKEIHVIPHGIIKIDKSNISKEELLVKYGFNKTDKILIFFGNIRDYKGLDILLKALAKIEDSKIKLIIAGKPWGEFDKYNNLIKKLNLEKRVKLFLEFVPDKKLAELFKISDLAVFPYREFEASSGAGTVALNFEKPMVVTKVGGLSELVIDKKVISKPNDFNDLKEKIIYALNNLERLKKDSIKKSEEFSPANIAKELKDGYLV